MTVIFFLMKLAACVTIGNMKAKELKRQREYLGLTQKQLAEKLQVARVTVTRWEVGLRKPSPIEILAIRAVLDQSAKAKRKP